MEETLTIIKPDGVKLKKIGYIIDKIEKKGFELIASKVLTISQKQAKKLYLDLNLPQKVHDSILKYVTSGKSVILVWRGKNAINNIRKICGPTDPSKAKKEQIRSLSKDILLEKFKKSKATKNIIHSSESLSKARKEIKIFFSKEELWK